MTAEGYVSMSKSLLKVRSENWSGGLPVELTLAKTSISSPTIPAPIHVLLSRHTFLHIGLQDAVTRLQTYAPPVFSFAKRVVEEPDTLEDDVPESLEVTQGNDEQGDSSTDDSRGKSAIASKAESKYPLCWFEDELTELPLQWHFFVGVLYDYHSPQEMGRQLPWKIRLHFTNYPSSQLLDLDASNGGVLATIQRTFKNSLKQALVLQHGQNKVALNMTKQTHHRIWDSIVTFKYSIYRPIQEEIQATKESISLIPIRMFVASSKPVIQKRCDDPTLSLGEILISWLPLLFLRDNSDQSIRPSTTSVQWRIAGFMPPTQTPIIALWESLCHPDGFLYIVMKT